jgi:hypothetical protein
MNRWILPGTLVLVASLAGCHDGSGLTAPTADAPALAASTGKVTNPRTTFTYLPVGSASGIFGDARAADGSATTGASVYDDGRCGVTSEIFANRVGDATMDPIGATISRKNCPAGIALGARSLTVKFGAPLAGAAVPELTGAHFTNVREVLALGSVGASGERVFTLLLRGTHTCGRLRYDEVSHDGVTGSKILVTRVSDKKWIARSQPDGNGRHVAFCQVGGDKDNPGTLLGAYDIPFEIEVVQK